VGLSGLAHRRLRDLSSGEQQRVALAGVLALRPRLLLLDEPTAHLDEATAQSALELIGRIQRIQSLTVLLTEHRLGLAAQLADRVLVLEAGQIVADGPPRSVFADASLASRGVPVPRATQAALRLGLRPPALTAGELAAQILAR
jgi:energy-coupling factor transporter ATP-binding protein EcfA2